MEIKVEKHHAGTCHTCYWPLFGNEVNRAYYPEATFPICGFALSPYAGQSIESAGSCKKWASAPQQEPLTWHQDPGSSDAMLQKGYYA